MDTLNVPITRIPAHYRVGFGASKEREYIVNAPYRKAFNLSIKETTQLHFTDKWLKKKIYQLPPWPITETEVYHLSKVYPGNKSPALVIKPPSISESSNELSFLGFGVEAQRVTRESARNDSWALFTSKPEKLTYVYNEVKRRLPTSPEEYANLIKSQNFENFLKIRVKRFGAVAYFGDITYWATPDDLVRI